MFILNIFYNFSEITVTILFPHTYSTFQQLNLSSTNKCQLNTSKVTRLGFEPTITRMKVPLVKFPDTLTVAPTTTIPTKSENIHALA